MLNKLCLCFFFNFYLTLYTLLVLLTGSCKFGEFISAAYYFIIEFVIVLTYFSHQSGIKAFWLMNCFSIRGAYEE